MTRERQVSGSRATALRLLAMRIAKKPEKLYTACNESKWF